MLSNFFEIWHLWQDQPVPNSDNGILKSQSWIGDQCFFKYFFLISTTYSSVWQSLFVCLHWGPMLSCQYFLVVQALLQNLFSPFLILEWLYSNQRLRELFISAWWTDACLCVVHGTAYGTANVTLKKLGVTTSCPLILIDKLIYLHSSQLLIDYYSSDYVIQNKRFCSSRNEIKGC